MKLTCGQNVRHFFSSFLRFFVSLCHCGSSFHVVVPFYRRFVMSLFVSFDPSFRFLDVLCRRFVSPL